MDFELADLYLAFRKAKAEAFSEHSQHNAVAFAVYERRLAQNLRALLRKLNGRRYTWSDTLHLGDYSYLPKSLSLPTENPGRVKDVDPLRDWRSAHEVAGSRSEVAFRLVIAASVDLQIVSALWILKVGIRLDELIDQSVSFGNRLRRLRRKPSESKRTTINNDSVRLFNPYFSDYQAWRDGGLRAMRKALAEGGEIFAVTMDLSRYYHNVNPSFLLRPAFRTALGYEPSPEEDDFTRHLLRVMERWYRLTPDYQTRPEGALPVGLSASKVIANVLLAEFDHAVQMLKPIYYGRYVDDVFLVLRAEADFAEHRDLMEWMASKLGGIATVTDKRDGNLGLRLNLAYATDSKLEFSGEKQKVFHLHAKHGLDLVAQIEDQIREMSSEHRLMPSLPTSDVEMASKALLATPDASLQADALRRADVVSVRRSGLALLLRNAEFYSQNLAPSQWQSTRTALCGLFERHVLTPRGLFDLGAYVTRAFSLMIASNDLDAAERMFKRFTEITQLLRDTTTAGTSESKKFERYIVHGARNFYEAAYQASTARDFKIEKRFVDLTRAIAELGRFVSPASIGQATRVSQLLLFTDWGRRPYKDYWYYDHKEDAAPQAVPRSMAVQRVLRLGGIRRFRAFSDLRRPHWPALAFPTRPLTFAEIALIAPKVLDEPLRLRHAIRALRGARVRSPEDFGLTGGNGGARVVVGSGNKSRGRGKTRIAVTSVLTTEAQWKSAVKGKGDRSLRRFERFIALFNAILNQRSRPHYVVLPELSIPRRWAMAFAGVLANNEISLIAGVEYYAKRMKGLRNDCLLSLVTRWPGYLTSILYLQPKYCAAHEERRLLKKVGKKLYTPTPAPDVPIYCHGGFFFSVLICSDLTNIAHRSELRGEIDAIFVLEWNPDTKTFGALVESTASDLHAFVIQVNNREYGDSRIRAPLREDYKRDVVQVKGGIMDYFVVADIDYVALRKYQTKKHPPSKGMFKPYPIGFRISASRKET